MGRLSLLPSLALSLLFVLGSAEAQLRIGFYSKSCPQAESIITEEIDRAIRVAPSIGGPLLRIFFHDCFVRGCDASLLLNSTSASNPTEKDARPNQFLRGFALIDRIKARLERPAPPPSPAPISLLSLRETSCTRPHGRRDGSVSIDTEALRLLPAFSANISTLKSQFDDVGLDSKDLVLLSGGHTIGNAHCFTFTGRLYNFSGRGDNSDTDPSLERNYLAKLRAKCAQGTSDALKLVEMDPGSFTTFDNSYFKLVAKRRGLFQSDAALLDDADTRSHVIRLAESDNSVFFREFAEAMVNMGNIAVLTGSQGRSGRTVPASTREREKRGLIVLSASCRE
ncbi:unnamed protein product [Spirodela intermedia]|uniref:Peroxidase n=1 Tax=Spirodela intermedia TaxID=51605 RepID=A0A7I8IK80_SPIIN|nr:unnamed protein product [Spirodela intermedia]CAA6658298.1 unnamed protein product [Spirodela intermedia]